MTKPAPIFHSNYFTMHETLGQTLLAIANRMSIDKNYFVWDLEALTVAMSRVRKLSHDHVVGTKKMLLKIKN